MGITLSFIHIPDKKQDIETISEFIRVTTIGIEAITQTYEDHRLFKNTSTRLFFLQENLIYRIYAVLHQYEFLVDGLDTKSAIDLNAEPFDGNWEMHPTIYRYSNQLSSIVDSIFFNLNSAFDYLGHYISYMFEKNKDRTLDWGKLAKTARASYKNNLKIADAIQDVDVKIRIKLDNYRSELIHRNRDLRHTGITKIDKSNQLLLTFAASADAMKHFKNIIPEYDNESNYTLELLPSLVIYHCLRSINYLIDYLKIDLISGSTFEENVKNPKNNELPYVLHPVTKKPHPKSEFIWSEYKQQLNDFYLDFEQRKTEAIRDKKM